MTIHFRADGDSNIGLGHIIRSVALADMLKADFNCQFLIQDPSDKISLLILNAGYGLQKLPITKDYAAEAEAIAETYINNGDIVVLDGYHFDINYHRKIRKKGAKLVCIDDLHEQGFDADAIINHSEGIFPADYRAPFYTRFFLGSKYALLRRPFVVASKSQRKIDNINTIFVNLGGADPDNITLGVLKKLDKVASAKKIHVVLGGAYLHRNTLDSYQTNSKVKLHHDLTAEKMCELMQDSQAAVCSASTVACEYSSVGGILLVIKTVENQKLMYDFLLKKGLAADFKDLQNVLSQPDFDMVKNQRKYFDGNSPLRLKQVFDSLLLEESITIRSAEEKDVMTYFEWANDKEVRQNSINKENIKLEDHLNWFNSKIKSENHFFCIAENSKGEALGQVRFDKKENETWLINFSIDRDERGKGIGEIMLHKSMAMIRKDINASLFMAYVSIHNTSSLSIFNKLGFIKLRQERIGNEDYFYFEKE
ncbi:hypothetical protein MYP_494 [Sporocytophaga myxococcoides]|uniref:N-acetyltransferase domain-containing protein n=1 Tax=Sporocytophaga myxococcoides TaxID=153721 RepID=A0A098LAU5_9BACT|nr:UDP-2,4-diacetamido-2,4,6-trideoxy-beta-L-altropyranose hydrolase [Sporocytophaga myxococcoides]GAL83268.1 hypothetical protein MYP_494 [Sporocytophaga myxococcoides]